MLTFSLILFPIIVGIILFFLNNNTAKIVASIAALIELGIAIYGLGLYKAGDTSTLNYMHEWLPKMGISLHFNQDGISILMVLLTALLFPLIILAARENVSNRLIGLAMIMQGALVGVFTSMDGFLFYIFWELALIPIYFICLIWGGKNAGKITFKFFIYTLAGSLLMLFALLYIYFKTPEHSFDIQALYNAGSALSGQEQSWLFWALFIAFAIKMPVFPFHTWQPKTYTTAPTIGTMLLSGIMLKMGTYGLIRWLLPMLPLGVSTWGKTAIILSIIGIIYASLIAIVQKNYKTLIAYSSIAHVGLISAGIMTHSVTGIQGSLIQMISHGINVIGLFFICDIILERTGTLKIKQLGGLRGVAPVFALFFLIVLLGSVALPLTNGFVGEFLLLKSIFDYNFWMAAIAGTTIILGAVYMLRSYQKVMLGETNELTATVTDLTWNEKMVLIPIVLLIIIIGIFPNWIFSISETTVQSLVDQIAAHK
jgi:NADH-quinone oxidoreductase subunit M